MIQESKNKERKQRMFFELRKVARKLWDTTCGLYEACYKGKGDWISTMTSQRCQFADSNISKGIGNRRSSTQVVLVSTHLKYGISSSSKTFERKTNGFQLSSFPRNTGKGFITTWYLLPIVLTLFFILYCISIQCMIPLQCFSFLKRIVGNYSIQI